MSRVARRMITSSLSRLTGCVQLAALLWCKGAYLQCHGLHASRRSTQCMLVQACFYPGSPCMIMADLGSGLRCSPGMEHVPLL